MIVNYTIFYHSTCNLMSANPYFNDNEVDIALCNCVQQISHRPKLPNYKNIGGKPAHSSHNPTTLIKLL